MSGLIPYEEDVPPPTAISRTKLQPLDPRDSPTLWRRFCDLLRRKVGMRPLDLAMRYSEAEVRKQEAEARSKEIDNEIKLMEAKLHAEVVQAELQKQAVEVELAKKYGVSQLRKSKAEARIQEAVARQVERLKLSPSDALDEVRRIIDKIRDAGGDVEIPGLDFTSAQSGGIEEPSDEEQIP